MVDLKPLSELRKVIEKSISDSIKTPTTKPATLATSTPAPKPLKEITKK